MPLSDSDANRRCRCATKHRADTGPIHDHLRTFCDHVVVAHPGRLRLISRAKRKNDRVDAEKLAKLLFLDEVPQIHVPSPDVRAWRELIEARHR
ncbi:MAG: hypothetical protein QM741_12550 [Rudaea sp.]|uniref:hypothetical protein n=1 Tax=Rudaea sp. TaxID=2136325 RepID=UPI0039E3A098